MNEQENAALAESREALSAAEKYDLLKKEYDNYVERTERERRARERRESMLQALRRAGVQRDDMLELLMQTREAMAEESDADQTAGVLKNRYGFCFEKPVLRGVERLSPPSGAKAGTDTENMTDDEYYARVLGQ